MRRRVTDAYRRALQRFTDFAARRIVLEEFSPAVERFILSDASLADKLHGAAAQIRFVPYPDNGGKWRLLKFPIMLVISGTIQGSAT